MPAAVATSKPPYPMYIGCDMDWTLTSPTIRGTVDAGLATVTAQLYGTDGSAVGSPITLSWVAGSLSYLGTFESTAFPEAAGIVGPNKPGIIRTTYVYSGTNAFWVDAVLFQYQE